MLRWSWYRVAPVLCVLAFAGCIGDQYVTEAPPRSAEEAEQWWAGMLERLEPDLVAVLCAASETHRQNGTTATYVNSFVGRTMVASYYRELRLPLPLPDAATAKAKARLVGWVAKGDQASYSPFSRSLWHWEGGKGCSVEKATQIWQEAEKKCGWAQGGDKAADYHQ
jgi:hypothetical protein